MQVQREYKNLFKETRQIQLEIEEEKCDPLTNIFAIFCSFFFLFRRR